jgi:hypothetical protein
MCTVRPVKTRLGGVTCDRLARCPAYTQSNRLIAEGSLVTMLKPTVQQRVQRTILQLVDATGRAHPDAVSSLCPGTDRSDLVRGVEVLVSEGLLGPTEDFSYPLELLAAVKGCFRLSEAGRLRLTDDN